MSNYNKAFFDTKSTEWIEANIVRLEARLAQQFKAMQKNSAHHVAINFGNTKSTLLANRAALADRKAGI